MPTMPREEIVNLLKNFFKEKKKNYGIEMVFLYGSWAIGFPKEESDVDIAIVFKKELASDKELFDSLNDISLSLFKALGLEVNAIPILLDFPKPMLDGLVRSQAASFIKIWLQKLSRPK